MRDIQVVGFDADDTLWANENYYRDSEKHFAELLSDYGERDFVMDELFQMEMKNLELFGYGIKPFIISMIECAIEISKSRVSTQIISQLLDMGKEMMMKPVELLPGVKEVLQAMHGKHKLIVVTKGDLLDQERKLKRSSLAQYFHHIEIMSEKSIDSYKALLKHLEVKPEHFVMIGNSMRSDILPPYELGCSAIYIPYALTWQHEMNVEEIQEDERFYKVDRLDQILNILT